MDRHQAKQRRDKKCLSMSPFLQVAKQISQRVTRRFCGVTAAALPAGSIPAKAGPLRVEGEVSFLGGTPPGPQGH